MRHHLRSFSNPCKKIQIQSVLCSETMFYLEDTLLAKGWFFTLYSSSKFCLKNWIIHSLNSSLSSLAVPSKPPRNLAISTHHEADFFLPMNNSKENSCHFLQIPIVFPSLSFKPSLFLRPPEALKLLLTLFGKPFWFSLKLTWDLASISV